MNSAGPAFRQVEEFHYRLHAQVRAHRPGTHPGTGLGAGQTFAAHARLFDHPDPRRLDLRASLRHPSGEWLVRQHRQRAAVPVHVILDVSASMRFGSRRSKLDVAGDFIESLGRSAFRLGDPVGLLCFDAALRDDLAWPARHSRGSAEAMRAMLELSLGTQPGKGEDANGLLEAAARLAGRHGLVFIVSDFHWSLEALPAALQLLWPARVVPLIVWDPLELEAPSRDGPMTLESTETGRRRTFWMRPALRARWREAIAQRRASIEALCRAAQAQPMLLAGAFDAEAMTRHFMELAA